MLMGKSLKYPDEWNTVRYGHLTVYYKPGLDGGGRDFGQDFVPVVKKLFGKVGRLCEFGSGPGFIGFSLLASGLCNSLILVDVNQEAITACRKTIRENRLEKRVKTYASDTLRAIPKNEKWDLVVSNPPHFNGTVTGASDDLLFIDPNWKVHEEFYKTVGSHLRQSGSVLFVENAQGSTPSQFIPLIRQGGLHFRKTFRHEKPFGEVIRHNLRVWLNVFKLDKATYYKKVFQRMEVRPGGLLNIFQDPYYFMWSQKKY